MSFSETSQLDRDLRRIWNNQDKAKNAINAVKDIADQMRVENKVDALKGHIDAFCQVELAYQDYIKMSQVYGIEPWRFEDKVKEVQNDLLSAITFIASLSPVDQIAIQEVALSLLNAQDKAETKNEFVDANRPSFRKLIPAYAAEDTEMKLNELSALTKELDENGHDSLKKLVKLKPFLTIEEDIKFYENPFQKNEMIIEKMKKAQEHLLKSFTSLAERSDAKEEASIIALKILLKQRDSQFVQGHKEDFKKLI